MTKNKIGEVTDFLLEFQENYVEYNYSTHVMGDREPGIYPSDGNTVLTLIYSCTKINAIKMYIDILNSIALRKRLNYLNLRLTDLSYTEQSVIIEISNI